MIGNSFTFIPIDSKPQLVMHSKAGFQEMKVSHCDSWKPSIITE